MRIAVVSDIHGNLMAFEAVLADLRQTSPDLIFHGGDLADSGARPAEIVDGLPAMTVANTGSVSLSYDGDCRAAYLLLHESEPVIRRVEYDLDSELKALSDCGLPHAAWIAKTLASGRFQMP